MAQADRYPAQGGLDPQDWDAFRARAHDMLDAALEQMKSAEQGAVWTPLPEDTKETYRTPLPREGKGGEAVAEQLAQLLPYGVGNTHPRFFGWVHGSGTPGNLMADIAAAALNANLGGRDHGAMYVEKQVLDWVRELFDFPEDSSGLVVSGTSVATVIALKTARDRALGWASRKEGVDGARLVGYTSEQTHSCVARAFDILGLGSDALRKIPTDADFRIDLEALTHAIDADRAAGYHPFAVIGTAGAVNVGSIDDLSAVADIAAKENLWMHVDGAFGALGVLSETVRPMLKGLERADSLAFDFHKWMHVNYDAGCVLIRSEEEHRKTFSERPEYLKAASRGLAAGNPWPVEYGPELSRGFRALKVWTQIAEHGTDRIGAMVERNCGQAVLLGQLVDAADDLELMAPVALNICCFRVLRAGLDDTALDALNEEIVIRLQEDGIAAPSTTKIHGRVAIRVNITNHRTQDKDMEILLSAIKRIVPDCSQEAAE
ncbi:pyridoxal phosphate-dependent decarboxylase family protein [Shimia thalassica]|uniref:pyridoxal phosphate-dependent decarboxylase family protein n=1 Tax=Shimia thalassica TaxID=1715693 RepID=UPI0026E149CD|nr:pyridoxal-dependent decarboxylase [Shimia thalassica]MDO6484529.1 pyridoxal-dependent decarboxylase [Shimia thalassica]